jgi:hypothetical protein
MPNEEALQQIQDLQEQVAELKKTVDLLKVHQHLGVDSSAEFLGQTEFLGRSITLGGGVASSDKMFAPLLVVDSVLGDSLKPDSNARGSSMAIWVTDKYQDAEQISTLVSASKILNREQYDTPINKLDWSLYSEARVRVSNNPQGSAAFSGPSVFGPLSFLIGEHTPLISSVGSLTLGGSTLVDSTANFANDSLVGCLVNIKNSSGSVAEAYKVITNTSNTITLGQYLSDGSVEYAAFTSLSGSYDYYLNNPMLLGAAETPYDRGYFGQDIRLGYGSSSGSQVIYIKWGNGTPEGVVTANIGSLYLRKDGGAGTVLYVKESGNGTSTGWSTTA